MSSFDNAGVHAMSLILMCQAKHGGDKKNKKHQGDSYSHKHYFAVHLV